MGAPVLLCLLLLVGITLQAMQLMQAAEHHVSPRRKGRGVITMPSSIRILAWYSDDDMWHERVLVWKGRAMVGTS